MDIKDLRDKIHKTEFDNKDKYESELLKDYEEDFKSKDKLSLCDKFFLGLIRFLHKKKILINTFNFIDRSVEYQNNMLGKLGLLEDENTDEGSRINFRNRYIVSIAFILIIFMILVGIKITIRSIY